MDDLARVRVLQSDLQDTEEVIEEISRQIARIDQQIGDLQEARDDLEDELQGSMDYLGEIARELTRYPQELIDAS